VVDNSAAAKTVLAAEGLIYAETEVAQVLLPNSRGSPLISAKPTSTSTTPTPGSNRERTRPCYSLASKKSDAQQNFLTKWPLPLLLGTILTCVVKLWMAKRPLRRFGS